MSSTTTTATTTATISSKKSKLQIKQMRKTNKLNATSKLSSLNKSIENFFIKFLNKTKNGGVTINKKIKTTAHSNSILSKSSPVKLINKYLLTNEQKKDEENTTKIQDNEIGKQKINDDEILIQNILNKLNDKSNADNFKSGTNEETSILKYLIESINNSAGLLNEQEIIDKNDLEENNNEEDNNNNESDDSYASAIIHDTSNSSSNDSTNQTFLIHEDNDKLAETSQNENNYLSNIQQTIILKALLESYPNLIDNLSLNDKQNENELATNINEKDSSNNKDEDGEDDDDEINSSVIIHNEQDQQSDSLNNSKNSDKSQNETFLIHNELDDQNNSK